MRINGAKTLGILVLIPAISACSPDRIEWDLEKWQGEFLDYHRSRSLGACQGTYAYVDGFVPFVAAELGVALPDRQQYLWLDEEDFLGASCASGVSGCADPPQAYALSPWYLHELVHTVAFESGQRNQPFFAEGLAVALDPWDGDNIGPRYVVSAVPGQLPDPRPLMALPTDQLHYSTAGSFVMFLLARHGSDKFMRMVQELGISRDLTVIRKVFQKVYQTDLDGQAEQFMKGTLCADNEFTVGLYDCTMPEVPWGDTQWSFQAVMDCGSEDVAGGLGPDFAWSSLRSITLDVPATGAYRIEAQSDGEVLIQMGPCSGCPWDLRDFRVSTGEIQHMELDAGTYFVRIRAKSDVAPNLKLLVAPE